MKLVKPISEEKRRELERELALEKERFLAASRRATDAIRRDLDVGRWLKERPLEAAALILFGGIALSQVLLSRRKPRPAQLRVVK